MESTVVNTKTKWQVDPAHSEIGFKVKHLMVSNVRGTFKDYQGNIDTIGTDFSTAKIDIRLNAVSINTKNEQRDAHLMSADFFDVENFREISFSATSTEKLTDGRYRIHGNLFMRGITKNIILDVEYNGIVKDPWGGERAGFAVTGKINRKDWGLNWNTLLETGGVVVSDDVYINCDIQLTKQING